MGFFFHDSFLIQNRNLGQIDQRQQNTLYLKGADFAKTIPWNFWLVHSL